MGIRIPNVAGQPKKKRIATSVCSLAHNDILF